MSAFLLIQVIAQAQPKAVHFPKKHFDFLDRYCLDCHDTDTQKGKVDLEDLSFSIITNQDAERWQKVLDVLNSGEMPPPKKKQPKDKDKVQFLDSLSKTMVDARKLLTDSGGTITMRRLNRREYQNTIQTLLGVNVDVSDLPDDKTSHGFDTDGSSLFMSADQIENYQKIAKKALEEAFAKSGKPKGKPIRFKEEYEKTFNVKEKKHFVELEKRHASFLKWKALVDEAAKKEINADVIKAFYKKNPKAKKLNHKIYFDANQLKGLPKPSQFGFKDAFTAATHYERYLEFYKYHQYYQSLAQLDKGAYLKIFSLHHLHNQHLKPKGLEPGRYRLRVRVAAVDDAPEDRRFISVGHAFKSAEGKSISDIQLHKVTGTMKKPQILDLPFEVPFGAKYLHTALKDRYASLGKGLMPMWWRTKGKNGGIGIKPVIWVDWAEISGPVEDQPSAKISYKEEYEKTFNVKEKKYFDDLVKRQESFLKYKALVDKAAKKKINAGVMKSFSERKTRSAPHYLYYIANQLKGSPDPKEFGFKDVHSAAFHYEMYLGRFKYHQYYQSLPHLDKGAYLKLFKVHWNHDQRLRPKGIQPGRYQLKARVAAVDDAPEDRRFISVGHAFKSAEGKSISDVQLHKVTGTMKKPQVLDLSFEVPFGGKYEHTSLSDRYASLGEKGLKHLHWRERAKNGIGPKPVIWVDWAEINGPLEDNSSAMISRREVEHHANKKVGGTWNGYYSGGYRAAKAFLAEDRNKPLTIDKTTIPDKQEAKFRVKVYEEHKTSYEGYLNDPLTKKGSLLTIEVNPEEVIALPPDSPSGWLKSKHPVEEVQGGEYLLRFRIAALPDTDRKRHYVELGSRHKNVDFALLETFQVKGTLSSPEVITFPVKLSQKGPRSFVLREKRNVSLDKDLFKKTVKETGIGPKPALWVDWVEWEGPLAKNQHSQKLSDRLDAIQNRDGVIAFIKEFTTEIFRGVEPSDDYLSRLIQLYDTMQAQKPNIRGSLIEVFSVVLSSPTFLYMNEESEDGKRRKLSQRELAVRLAYFLWSSPPDETLLSLTERGVLLKQDNLKKQIDRMLDDPRSENFIKGFVHQWLHMDRLDFFQFDSVRHPSFDSSIKEAARQEVFESFAYLVDKNEPLKNLLKSDYIIANNLLADYYGLEPVKGQGFQKVQLPKNSPRGGLLGMAAIMAMGSNGEHTSPVERGAWVLRYLLNDPPPPAPANVPQISRLEDKILTTRERVLLHQEKPQCASCHRKIDPIGFGLENFNAVGLWRTEDEYHKKGLGKKRWKIDASGKLHNGPKFSNFFELRNVIASKDDDFARGFTEALIAYSLGRPFGFSDQDFADKMLASSKRDGFKAKNIIHRLVASDLFQRK